MVVGDVQDIIGNDPVEKKNGFGKKMVLEKNSSEETLNEGRVLRRRR